MKKTAIVAIAFLILTSGSPWAFSDAPTDTIFKIDAGAATYGTAKLRGSVGINMNFLLSLGFLDFALNNRFFLVGLTGNEYLYQGALAVYYRQVLPNTPVVLFAGPGVGAAMSLGGAASTGFMFDATAGAELSITQRMAAVAKIYFAGMLFSADGATTQLNGAGVEVGLRFAFGDTKRLPY